MEEEDDKFCMCILSTKHGDWLFKSRGAFVEWQELCQHPVVVDVYAGHHDYRICERCLFMIERRMADHHPDIARFHDDGGPALS